MYKRLIVIYISLAAFSLCGCTPEVRPSPEPQSKSENSSKQTKEADRGYDPCLINANLPVCQNK